MIKKFFCLDDDVRRETIMVIREKIAIGNAFFQLLTGLCFLSMVFFLSTPCEAEREHNLIVPYNQYDLDISSDDVAFYPESHIEWSRLVLLDLDYVLDENVPVGDEGLVLNLFETASGSKR